MPTYFPPTLYYGLSYPTVILTFSWYTLFSQMRKWRPSHSSITVSPGMEEIPSLNMPVQRLKVAILPLDLPCSGPVTHSGKILTTGKSYGLPRVMKHYSPTGRRNHGRPLKRLLDMWDWNGSTSGPTPWQIYDDDDNLTQFQLTQYLSLAAVKSKCRWFPCSPECMPQY